MDDAYPKLITIELSCYWRDMDNYNFTRKIIIWNDAFGNYTIFGSCLHLFSYHYTKGIDTYQYMDRKS